MIGFAHYKRRGRGRPTGLLCLCAGVVAVLGVQNLVAAQDSQSEQPADLPPAHGGSDEANGAGGLASQPVVSEPLGLRLHPPKNARVEHGEVRGKPSVLIADGQNNPPAWTLRVLRVVTVESNPSPAEHVQKQIDKLKKAAGDSFTIRVLSNEARRIADRQAQLCYIEQSFKEGRTVVSGTLLVPAGGRNMLAFTVYTMPQKKQRVQSLMNAVFDTIELQDTEQVVKQLSTRLQNGRNLLDSLTPQRLKSLAGQSMWTRIYKPAQSGSRETNAGGQREVGYSHVKIFNGPRGAVDFNKDPKDYNAAEKEQGLVVRITGRVIGNRQRGIFYDSVAVYWMAWDQSEELWSVVGTHRQGKASRSEAETGLRLEPSVGQPEPVLQVIRAEASGPYEWDVPNVYLSQPLAWLLGKVLPRDIDAPREYAWYHYNGREAEPKLTRRVDRWAPANDGTGYWILTTRLKPDAAPIVTRYDAQGDLIRQKRPDGVVMEPSSLEELRRLWQRKGLPLKTDS